jgi:hypothetical protein
MKEKSYNTVINLVAIYFIISQFMALYFWYLWAQIHGFVSTLIIGPIVGEIKGLLWPFFI